MRKQIALYLATLVGIVAVGLLALSPMPRAEAAPQAAITPAGILAPVTGQVGNLIPVVTAVVTADYQVCRDFREYSTLDLQTVVVQNATPNAVTIKTQHSNDGLNFTDGPQIAATVTSNSSYMNRYDQYGVFTCINIDVASPSVSNTVGVKVLALPRK